MSYTLSASESISRMESPGRSATVPQLLASMERSQRHLLLVPQYNNQSVLMDAKWLRCMMWMDVAFTMNVNVS